MYRQTQVLMQKPVVPPTLGAWLPVGAKGMNAIVVHPEQGVSIGHFSDPEKNPDGYTSALTVSPEGEISLQSLVNGNLKIKTISVEKADEILKHLFAAINKEVGHE